MNVVVPLTDFSFFDDFKHFSNTIVKLCRQVLGNKVSYRHRYLCPGHKYHVERPRSISSHPNKNLLTHPPVTRRTTEGLPKQVPRFETKRVVSQKSLYSPKGPSQTVYVNFHLYDLHRGFPVRRPFGFFRPFLPQPLSLCVPLFPKLFEGTYGSFAFPI